MMVYTLILCDDWSPSHRGDGTQHKHIQLKVLGQRQVQSWGSSERECGIYLETNGDLPKERTLGQVLKHQ